MAEQRTKTTKKQVSTEASAKAPRKAATKAVAKKAASKKTATTTATKAKAPAKKTARKSSVAKGFAAAGPPGPMARRPRASRPATTPQAPSEEARALALIAAEAGLDKKAVGIEILDVLGKVDYTDYLVLMTGRSDRHVDAIAHGIMEALGRLKNKEALSIEGLQAGVWVLIDFGDIVVHVFQEEARETYDIAGLWLDAARLPVPEGAGE